MTLGKHCFTEAYECPRELLQSLNKTSLTLLDISSHKFEPQGVTIVALLSESHISIHTWPERGSAALDVFTCGETNPEVAMMYMIEALKAREYNLKCIKR